MRRMVCIRNVDFGRNGSKVVLCLIALAFLFFALTSARSKAKSAHEQLLDSHLYSALLVTNEDQQAELLQTHCYTELINAEEDVEDPKLHISINKFHINNEFISRSSLLTRGTLLDCLRKNNRRLLSGEEALSKSRYTKFLEFLFRRANASRRRHMLQIAAPAPAPSPTILSPQFSPAPSPVHDSVPISPQVPDSPPSAVSPVPTAGGEASRRNSASTAQSNKGNTSHRTIVIAVTVTAGVTFVFATLLFCCCFRVCRGQSALGKNDERPLLSLSLNEYSAGSSHKLHAFGDSISEGKLDSQLPSDSSCIDSNVNGTSKAKDSPVKVWMEHSIDMPPSSLKPPPGKLGTPGLPPLKPPPGKIGSLPPKPLPPRPSGKSPSSPPLPPCGKASSPPPPPHRPGNTAPSPSPPPPSPGNTTPCPPPPPLPPSSMKLTSNIPRPPPRGPPSPPLPPGIKTSPCPPPPPRSGIPPPRPPTMGLKPLQASPLGSYYPSDTSGEGSEVNAPKTKLKPLFWDKVKANPDHSMVWHQIRSGSFQFNEEMIESLFGYAPHEKSKTDQKKELLSQDRSTQYVQIIDLKKAQNLSILLRALNVTTEEVCDALQEGNELPPEFLQTLMKMSPTTEEELKLRLFSGELSRLRPADRFLKVMVDIPFAFQRMESLLFMCTLQEDASTIKESFVTLEAACTELKKSRLFLKLLEAVLKTGNRMNDGTYRGGAQAFKLDTLLKLSDVKGIDGKTTLLHFVVQEIIRSEGVKVARIKSITQSEDRIDDPSLDPEEHYCSLGLQVVSGLSAELVNVKRAAVLDPDSITGTVAKLGQQLRKTQEFLNSKMKNIDEEKGFHQALKSFVQNAEVDVLSLLEEEKRIMALVRSTIDYFHGNAGKDEGLRLFVIVRDFLIMLDKVCKEVKDAPRKHNRTPNKEGSTTQPSSEPSRRPNPHQRLFPAIRDRRIDYSSSDEDI
ncbi:hypothetical protein NMG60_11002266 [Bertholletia excelsa]